ncbi:MAG: glutamate-5-semialdehyde dehydrogenase [Phycisphaerae bacterium]|nr:glutamate-5-semialdehyde dehydrogenase [Phycisphaerae bacterium]
MNLQGTGGVAGIEHAACSAREASRVIAGLETKLKNRVLVEIASLIAAREAEVLAANAADMSAARAAGLPSAKLRRLELSPAALEQVRAGLEQVAALPDPVGMMVRDDVMPSGLRVRQERTPLGVILMIFEARPAVTIDAFALCFKSGNACILKGGREAARAARVFADIAREALEIHGCPGNAVTVLPDLSRDDLRHLLTLDRWIDLCIPRGGTELIRFVREHSTIPTVQHYRGVCHVYVDESADLEEAERICVTAKTSAPAACNAVECILVHRAVAPRFVSRLVAAYAGAGVEVRADQGARVFAPAAKEADSTDWGSEFLDLVVALRLVDGMDEAIAHIARYGSDHTEAILTRSEERASRFVREVRSSCVLVNASTRFNDGFHLGLGAEIGISTSRVHAYGPMGLEELTTKRFIVEGSGQTR